MEYLNTKVFLSVYALKYLDLSMNKHEAMNRHNKTEFQDLINPLSDLSHINLSRNGLFSIPTEFTNNSKMEIIYLSGNQLQQVYLELIHLKNLKAFKPL